jgi:hypothetical protein
MSAPTDPANDPDIGARAVGEQVSAVTNGLATTQKLSIVSTTAAGSISLDPVRDPLLASDIPLAPQSHFRSRSGFVVVGLFAFILAVALTSVIAITQFPLADSGSQPAIGTEPAIPQLVVQSSHGRGEPARLGLRVQGQAEGAVVIIRGLAPGMELSTGGSVGGDAWRLSADDLHYAWIAPPQGFVGSADLIVELRLSNDQIADRRAIRLEWMAPISPAPGERQLDREEITAAPPRAADVLGQKSRQSADNKPAPSVRASRARGRQRHR